MRKFTIGIIREEKIPPDNRAPLTPRQCHDLCLLYPNLDIRIETSSVRCFEDADYRKFGMGVQNNLDNCDLLMGIKEVPVAKLLPGKSYMFFSHTIKKQAHNKDLLKAILDKGITLIDYELVTDENGHRTIGFGNWAGVVGAHYALLMLGKKKSAYELKPASKCVNYQELVDQYDTIRFPKAKFVITGGGRAARGAVEIMLRARINQVNAEDFLNKNFDGPVFVQLHSQDLYQRKDGKAFDVQDFYHHAGAYQSVFQPYLTNADVLINCSYWDINAPMLFEVNDMQSPGITLNTISDVSCDIPGSLPVTIRQTTSADPVYGYRMADNTIAEPYGNDTIDVMAIPNLPNELPRDASRDFGHIMIETVIPRIMHYTDDPIINRAIIAQKGHLMPAFSYLEAWANS